MNNLIELLLEQDEEKLVAVPSKEFEIKRLSEITGQPFVVTVKALTSSKFEQIDKLCTSNKGKVDGKKMNSLIVIDAVYQDEEKLFRNTELKEKFKSATPQMLVEKLLLTGEIAQIASMCIELMGFNDGIEEVNLVEEIKN